MSALTDAIDAEVAALIPQVQSKQTAFANTHNGRFYQGVRTPVPIPADGADGIIDKTVHPSDQVEDWNAFGLTLPVRQKWSIEILSYDGASGKGFVLGAWVTEGIRTKLRRWNFGPETHRNVDWTNTTSPTATSAMDACLEV